GGSSSKASLDRHPSSSRSTGWSQRPGRPSWWPAMRRSANHRKSSEPRRRVLIIDGASAPITVRSTTSHVVPPSNGLSILRVFTVRTLNYCLIFPIVRNPPSVCASPHAEPPIEADFDHHPFRMGRRLAVVPHGVTVFRVGHRLRILPHHGRS